MTELIRKLCRDRRLTTAEYERLIRQRTADSARELRRLADQTRRAAYGNRVLIRGAVELSSICKNDCLDCIQRRSNSSCYRYRLRPRELFDCFEEGYGLGHRSFLLRANSSLNSCHTFVRTQSLSSQSSTTATQMSQYAYIQS